MNNRSSEKKNEIVGQAGSLSAAISHVVGVDLAALALVGSVGSGAGEQLAAFIMPNASSMAFRHAVDLEFDYTLSLMNFDGYPDTYSGQRQLDIEPDAASQAVGVDRLIYLVIQDVAGEIYVLRNYDGLEMTLLESANEQIRRFKEVLGISGHNGPHGMH